MKKGISLILAGLIAMPLTVKANVGSMSIEGTTLNVGETKTIDVLVSDNVAAVDGFVTSLDNSCIEVVNVESPFGSNNYFATVDLQGNALTKATTITVKGLKECKTSIKISDASMVSADGMNEDRNLTFVSDTINVIEQKNNEIEKTNEISIIEPQSIEKSEPTQNTNIEKENNIIAVSTSNKSKKKITITSKKIAKLFKLTKFKLFELI